MVGALWTGISGLGGSQIGLDNESNNIANVNTIGYKASRVSFADQMYQDKIGKGVTSFDVEKMYTQGNLKLTGVSYDMALSGDGFFQVKDGSDTYYTRAGNFRMGEGGTLEDVGQKKVQGWAMQPVTLDDITATDPNATFFTNDFSELLGNKVIRDTTTIETIVAKATNYRNTATTDSNSIFTGAGYKSASTKVADIEALRTEYNAALSVYAEADPKPTASSSNAQKDFLNYGLTAGDLAEGDEIYVYIDGKKYSQTFDTDQETTMKKFVDQLSDTTGFNAFMTGSASSYVDPDTETAPEAGFIVLESLIPGKQIRITELGWTDSSNSNLASKGTLTNVTPAVLGTGMGHINSIKDALAEAVSGKQTDVYTVGASGDMFISSTPANNNFTYQIEIYNKESKLTEKVPTTPLTITAAADLDAVVSAINANADLNKHVKAFNINGNLVVKTLDKNYDVEFTGTLTGRNQEQETLEFNSAATANGNVVVSLSGTTYTTAVLSGDSPATIASKVAAQINSDLASAPDADVASVTVTGNKITVVYSYDAAAQTNINVTAVPTGVTSTATEIVTKNTSAELPRNPNFSNREGAGAEFLQIETTVNQTASRSDIQLRLDTLNLTDNAFGDFEIDDSGMVTMTQNGARFAIGQVAVARFTDNRGLEPIGDNLLMETTRSGTAIFNVNNDKMAEIKGGTLELSTADLSESLVNLMVFQRAFEANAKSITTADTILNTLIQLKR